MIIDDELDEADLRWWEIGGFAHVGEGVTYLSHRLAPSFSVQVARVGEKPRDPRTPESHPRGGQAFPQQNSIQKRLVRDL
jgi:hypothetical protein